MEIRDALKEAIQAVFHEHAVDKVEKGFITDWTLTLEMIGSDGEIYLQHITEKKLPPWKELGMLLASQDDVRDRMRESSTDKFFEE